MRKALIGLLLAAIATAPALADKGGKGHGSGHGGRPKATAQARHGGGHALREHRQDFRRHVPGERPSAFRHPNRHETRFDRPIRMAREDKQARKAWKREIREERGFRKAVAQQQQRFRPAERWARAVPARYDAPPIYRRPAVRYEQPVIRYRTRPAYYRPEVRYAQPVIRYAPPRTVLYTPAYVPSYRAPLAYGYRPLDDDDYPASYDYDPGYGYYGNSYGLSDSGYPGYGSGLFGGGEGLMAALTPVLLQSVMGGDLGLGGLGGLTGYDSGINVLPLQQAGYAPYLSGGSDLGALLLPSVLGNSFF